MSNYDIGIIGKWVKESTCNNKYHWRIAGFITHWTVKECIAQCADRGLVTRVQGLIKTWFRCWSVKMRCCELQGDYSPGIHHAIQILGTETRRTGGEGWWQPGDYYSLLGNGWCVTARLGNNTQGGINILHSLGLESWRTVEVEIDVALISFFVHATLNQWLMSWSLLSVRYLSPV